MTIADSTTIAKTSQRYEEGLFPLLQDFHLIRAWEKWKETNPSIDLPYHNKYHTICMMRLVAEAAKFHDLPWESWRALLIAAMFHDYDHSGGHRSDSENIERALLGVRPIMAGWSPLVEVLIQTTEYPYVIEARAIEQKIIRDADLLQSLQPHDVEMCIVGLRDELNVKREVPLSVDDMFKGQSAFLETASAKLQSKWARDKYADALFRRSCDYGSMCRHHV